MVVGRTADREAAEGGDGLGGEDAAEGVGGEQVAGGAEGVVEQDGFRAPVAGAQLVGELGCCVGADVGDAELRARVGEAAGDLRADFAEADDDDSASGEAAVSVERFEGGAHAGEDGGGGEGGGVAAAPERGGESEDVGCPGVELVDFGGGGADIGGGDEAPADLVEELGVGAELGVGLGGVVADHDGLAAAELETGDGGLFGHGGGEAERVVERGVAVGVGLPAGTADGGAEGGGVDGGYGVEVGLGIAPEEDFLVLAVRGGDALDRGHGGVLQAAGVCRVKFRLAGRGCCGVGWFVGNRWGW